MTVTVSAPWFTCSVDQTVVVTRFPDGTSALTEILRGADDHYRNVAAQHGYGDNWRLYAQHHDVIHNVVWGELFAQPSPVLWGVAHGMPQTDEEAYQEEQLVAKFHWTIMTDDKFHHNWLDMNYPEWREAFHSLEFALENMGLLPQGRIANV